MSTGVPLVSPPTISAVIRDEAFDAAVDEEQPNLRIRDQPIRASDALFSDPTAYQAALVAWREERRELLRQRVIDEFPHPIAHCFHRALHAHATQNQRLQFLRDTWEATVALLFTLVVAEVDALELTIETKTVRREYLASQTVRERIEVIDATRRAAFDLLQSAKLVSNGVVARLIALNDRRNREFAHLATLSEAQSERLANDAQEELEALFEELTALAEVVLLRPEKAAKGGYRCETFCGESASRSYDHVPLSATQRNAIAGRDNATEEVWAKLGDMLFCLSPYFTWRSSTVGHRSELAYLKKRQGAQLEYEAVGTSERIELSQGALLGELKRIAERYVREEGL